jgi:thiol-disulfide isomerase/thioredoxin
MNFNIRLGILILLLMGGILLACSLSVNENKESGAAVTPDPTKQIPSFQMTNVAGEVVDLRSFKGKKVFVNLWASWCPPCRAELPSIEGLSEKLTATNTVFVMLSLDENFETAKAYAARKKIKLPVYYPAGQLPPLFNTESIPVTFVFDEEGSLIKQINGSDNYDTESYRKLLAD